MAIPFELVLIPLLGAEFAPLLLLKLMILKKMRYIRGLLDEFDGLHPVAFRLIPLALSMPLLVHMIANHESWSSSGNLRDTIYDTYLAIT
jgi:hypothetical protein